MARLLARSIDSLIVGIAVVFMFGLLTLIWLHEKAFPEQSDLGEPYE